MEKFDGSRSDAQQKWPQRAAIGKLNVVFAEAKDPRLVLDSTVCNANACRIPEQVMLPSSLDARRSFLPTDRFSSWAGIALDVKAAHKRIKVRTAEQGALLFEWQGSLYFYKVCHFGANSSAYSWQRLGALLTRLLRGVLSSAPHRAWLYVDDLLLLLTKFRLKEDLAVVVAFLAVLGVPILWRKAQLSAEITWCGWIFNFDMETVHLTQEKLAKLRKQLSELSASKKLLRKKLESSLGLLMWATSRARHLRPYLAPLYKDLHSAKGALKQIHHSQWQPFLDSLNQEATVCRQPIGVWLPLHAK